MFNIIVEFIRKRFLSKFNYSINKKNRDGDTPLDEANSKWNPSPIQEEIIDLIRSKGGKRAREL